MTGRRKLVIGAIGGVIAVAAVGFAALWYFFLRDTTPPPVSLGSALTVVANATPSTSSGAASSSDLTGTWSLQSANGGSFAGYRVNENLAAFGSRTAVGRTQALQGTLSYDGHSVSAVRVTADLTSLKSDQPLRDETLKQQAIRSCQFPSATFELSTPIVIDGTPGNGGSVSKTVQGNLTLHGVTRPVSIDVKGQLQNGQLAIVGSTDIKFADYNISQPRSVFVVSLDDHGTMEFQLIFARSAAGTSAPTAGTPSASATPASGCGAGGFPPPFNGTPPAGFPPRPNGTPPAGGFPGGPPGGGAPGGGFGINTPAPVPSPVG